MSNREQTISLNRLKGNVGNKAWVVIYDGEQRWSDLEDKIKEYDERFEKQHESITQTQASIRQHDELFCDLSRSFANRLTSHQNQGIDTNRVVEGEG